MDRPKHLRRERMNRLLSDIQEYPLTIVEAPAGYGKTTAVRDYLSCAGLCSLWFSFSTGGEPAELLWAKLAQAVSKIDAGTGSTLKSLGYPADALQREKILTVLNRREPSKPLAVIFDNYEQAADPEFGLLLLRVAEEEIENLHLVILTRDTTTLDFVPLLSRGKCHVISQPQIKFTPEEIRAYCGLAGSGVSREDAEQISAYTDGWISMAYVMLLGLAEGIPVGMTHTLDELIDRMLYENQDDGNRLFLRQLSVMDGFTAGQAAFVTGNVRAGELLRRLRRQNAFLFYDERKKEYRIHNVLLDFLRDRQNLAPEERQVLFRRLGEWYLRQDDLFHSFTYFARAGETERILIHLNSSALAGNLFVSFDGADALFASAPDELLLRYPIAWLRYLLNGFFTRKKEIERELPRRLDELERYWQKRTDADAEKCSRVLAEILCVRKFMVFNDMEKMHTFNESISRLLDGRQSFLMIRNNEFTFGSPHYLYIYFREKGSLRRLTELCQSSADHVSFSDGCGTGSDSLARAEYACETGDYALALTESRKAEYQAAMKSQWSVILCARFCAMRASLAMGQIAVTWEILRSVLSDTVKWNSPVCNSMAEFCKGYLYATLGMPEKMPLWLQEGDLSSFKIFFGGMGFDKLVYGKALLARGEYLKLEALSGDFREAFGVYSNRLGFLHGSLQLAAAKGHLYGAQAGLPDLEEALAMAEPDGIVLPFAEYAPHLLPVFRVMPENPGSFTRHVFSACEQYAGNLSSVFSQKPELTDREKETVALLAEGLSRKEIAERLHISPGTVRTHLQSIYRKLEVDDKISAVKAARMHGYL